eukprot:CAMPEP_0204441378 /NCGR_PEP_ID=MMETSP0470-20130426/85154_1 /ASSEMBLY_ACC=CAM_ASM_000385 /TAXON_ID=2969 /ORGANISM="Oxyrrhis marina" /LENGTH=102 /DNA_ID=CAMNT_0051440501 /DNA_START=387 /DNA_END=695 /DNA_ORIENTATION=+
MVKGKSRLSALTSVVTSISLTTCGPPRSFGNWKNSALTLSTGDWKSTPILMIDEVPASEELQLKVGCDATSSGMSVPKIGAPGIWNLASTVSPASSATTMLK